MPISVPYQDELDRQFRVAYLIGHFIQEDLSEEEEKELEDWIQQSDHNLQIFEDLTDESTVHDFMQWYFEQDIDRKLEQVKEKLTFRPPRKTLLLRRYAAAASIVALLGTGIYLYSLYSPKSDTHSREVASADLNPGQSSAILTLANGRRVALGHALDTIINSEVSIENGIAVYHPASGEPEYHELSIPRKGFYRLVLPDGSRVWINSSSSIRYPSQFTGAERRVTVTGETYFEVAKDRLHPFVVSVNGTEVTAVGTAFNINAYPNEDALRVMLTEGAITVEDGRWIEHLKAGEEISIRGEEHTIADTDPAPVVAWTRNQFRLKNVTIQEVMRMAERWYDARAIYRDSVTEHFTGTIDRSVPLSHLLNLLAATGEVHFQIEGDTILVSR
jgi:ferric-dicitrate binding protein FerR (iron transport regulator)